MRFWPYCDTGRCVAVAFGPGFSEKCDDPDRQRSGTGFLAEEYESYPARFCVEAIAPIQNKVGASKPVLNRILTQTRSAFDLREVMDGGKILPVNLAKGKIGEDSAGLLGALLVSRIGLAALSRADVAEMNAEISSSISTSSRTSPH
jgi:hypothetical protein